jgi:glycosyltransferase involved in cell wall biosynthesis
LRDSVRHGTTGLITEANTPEALAASLTRILADEPNYQKMRTAAWQWSKEITFDTGYTQFKKKC